MRSDASHFNHLIETGVLHENIYHVSISSEVMLKGFLGDQMPSLRL